MRHLKRIVSKLNWALSYMSGGPSCSQLDEVGIASGLGDSAWVLYGLTRSLKPDVAVEIGSARGKSACYIGMALKENGSGKLYAIDPHMRTNWNDTDSDDTFNIIGENLRKLSLQEQVEVVRQTSDEVAHNWTRSIDLLFIDGDHSYEGVKHDWDTFSPFVQQFGVVIFHDTLWDLKPDHRYARPDMGVPKFVEELREQGFPVMTIDHDFGVSLVQPVRHGVPLKSNNTHILVGSV